MKKTLVYILSFIFLAVSVSAIGISYEDETGYTWSQGVGSFADGQSWFSGEVLGSEIVPYGTDMDDGHWSDTSVPETNEQTTHDGQTNCRHCVDNPAGWDGFESDTFTVVQNTLYKYSFKIKVISGAVLYRIRNGDNSDSMVNSSTTAATWTTTSGYYTEDTGGASASLYFINNSDADAAEWYVDEVSIKSVTSISTQYASTGNLLKLTDSSSKVAFGYSGAAEGGLAKTALPNNITGITKADPGVVTSTAHDLTTGMQVYFSGLTEMTELNNTYKTVTVLTANTFSINDTSGYGAAETTGGACGEEVTSADAQAVTVYKKRALVNEGWDMEAGFDMNDDSITFDVYRMGKGAISW